MGFLNEFSGLFEDIRDIQAELTSAKNELVTSVRETVSSASTATSDIEQAARRKKEQIVRDLKTEASGSEQKEEK